MAATRSATSGSTFLEPSHGDVVYSSDVSGFSTKAHSTGTPPSSVSEESSSSTTDTAEPIAIVGLGCRLPGNATSPSKFWESLLAGESAHGEVPKTRFNIDGFSHTDASRPGSIPSRGGYFLRDDIRHFDNSFFGISNLEAKHLDPQQRQLLEVVFEALEAGGQTLESLNDSNTGVYVGNFTSDFHMIQLKDSDFVSHFNATGSAAAILANRLSYVYNLHGPSFVMDTACSSSLYAAHMACTALENGDCDAAIVASANLIQSPELHLQSVKAGILSPDSTCYTFDSRANGYGRAEGVGALFLKRYSDAVRDGDPIRAVIRGTAINSNGRTTGVSLPSADLQAAVIRKAYKRAGLSTNATQYVEAHGTGTPVGDPLEVEGLTKAIVRNDRSEKLLIGSVKSNLGHSEAASGISSIIKVVLAMEHGRIPPSINIQNLNPRLKPFEDSIEVVQKTIPWPVTGQRRAGVNSFGFGGANAHLILDSPTGSQSPARELVSLEPTRPRRLLLPLSAHSERSLDALIGLYDSFLQTWQGDARDLAFTLGCRRSRLQYRAVSVANTSTLGKSFLREGSNLRVGSQKAKRGLKPTGVVFVFSGQGAQWRDMALGLLTQFPSIQTTIAAVDRLLPSLAEAPKWSLSDFFGDQSQEHDVDDPSISQLLCTAVQIIVVDLCRSWGVQPSAVIGHSSGEIGAAYAAGALSVTEAIAIAYYRGIHTSRLDRQGAMAAVGTDAESAVRAISDLALAETVSLACINSGQSVTLSGDRQDVEKIQQHFADQGGFARLLRTGGTAYHSHHMKTIGAIYEESLKSVLPAAGDRSCLDTRMVSTVTGQPVSLAELRRPAYWRANLESTVRFEQAASDIFSDFDGTVIEIGPHSALQSPIGQIWSNIKSQSELQYLPTLQRKNESPVALLNFAGELFLRGLEVSIDRVNELERRTVVTGLPSYPWDHQAIHWHESRFSREFRETRFPRHHLLGLRIPGGSGSTKSWRNILRIKDVEWLKDHQLRQTTVFPAAGYIAIAVEALRQSTDGGRIQDSRLQVKAFYINKALIIPEDTDGVEIVTTLSPTPLSATSRSKRWFTFEVCSFSGNSSTSHVTGQIAIVSTEIPCPELPKSASYNTFAAEDIAKKLLDVGLHFGPTFRTLASADLACSQNDGDQMHAKTQVRAYGGLALPSNYTEDAVHPTLLDSLFQSALLAGTRGSLDEISCHVPLTATEITIDLSRTSLLSGKIFAQSQHRGFGSLRSDALLLDDLGIPVIHVKELGIVEYDTLVMSDGHSSRRPIQRVAWKPDLSHLMPKHADNLKSYVQEQARARNTQPGDQSLAQFQQLLELTLHKNSSCHILMLSSEKSELSTNIIPMLQPDDGLQRIGSISFATAEGDGLHGQTARNIPSSPKSSSDLTLEELSQDLFFDLVVTDSASAIEAYQSGLLSKNLAQSNNSKRVTDERSNLVYLLLTDDASTWGHSCKGAETLFQDNYPSKVSALSSLSLLRLENTPAITSEDEWPNKTVFIVQDKEEHPLIQDFRLYIEKTSKFNLQTVQFDAERLAELPDYSYLILPMELREPLLDRASQTQFEALQAIVTRAKVALWLAVNDTIGASTDPSTTLVYGFGRALMLEQPAMKLPMLDLDHAAVTSEQRVDTFEDMISIMKRADVGAYPEVEFARHNGLLYCSRFIVDGFYNEEFRVKQSGGLTTRPLESMADRQLECQALGQLDTLYFKELLPTAEPPSEGFVDVLVQQVGLNYKDLAVAFSSIDTHDGNCGLEFVGTIASIPSPDSGLLKGDRVVVLAPAKLRKYERVPEWTCRKLHVDEDSKELATIPMVYSTAIYAIEDVARMQPGESILIHSAAGGLGQAAIQIAKLAGAEIFATVGTEDKKRFISSEYGINPANIFSSRDDGFCDKIKEKTFGEGVDVVLNSLTGDLLHASVQCCAKFGRFVEVGRRDIEESGKLDMSVFRRNISFTAFDLSHYYYSPKKSHNAILAGLFTRAIQLYRDGKIKASKPIISFDVSKISEGFKSLVDPARIGKVVIDLQNEDSMVRVLPMKYGTRFNPKKEYLLVGGLGGLGRSVSEWMIEQGAKYLTFISRSGSASGSAKEHIEKLESKGACITVARGSVDVSEDIERVINSKQRPLGGVIHAAMSLDEALFPQLTAESWHTVVRPKVQGAWNLHRALAPYEHELDFFIMTSSVSGSVGTATEANYGAANTFLDGFARYRRSLGLKAVSLALGMISEVGYLHEHPDIQKLMVRRGVHPINRSEKLQIFDLALLYESDTAVLGSGSSSGHLRGNFLTGLEAIGVEVQRQLGYEGDNAVLHDARSSLLARNYGPSGDANKGTASGGDGSSDEALALLSELREMGEKGSGGEQGGNSNTGSSDTPAVNNHGAQTEAAARTAVCDIVKQKMSNLLLTPLDQLHDDTLLSDFGMDSMLGAEFRAHIFHTLRVDVPFMAILGTTTSIISLAELIVNNAKSRKA